MSTKSNDTGVNKKTNIDYFKSLESATIVKSCGVNEFHEEIRRAREEKSKNNQ